MIGWVDVRRYSRVKGFHAKIAKGKRAKLAKNRVCVGYIENAKALKLSEEWLKFRVRMRVTEEWLRSEPCMGNIY